jgi:CHAD domain-containing protein
MKKLWKNSKSLKENLQKRLPKLAADYFSAGRVAMAPGTSWHDMHQFRLATKRFRYTLETFRVAYGPGIALRIDALKQIQTYLGDINDYIVTSGMLESMPDTAELRAKLSEKADGKTRKLHSYWLREFDAVGQQDRWVRYLRCYPCRRRPLARAPRPATVILASQP